MQQSELLTNCTGWSNAQAPERNTRSPRCELHEQQKVIAGLLQNSELLKESKVMNKELWVSLLNASGFTDKDMVKWHRQFERTAPELHFMFLKQLQIPEDEIEVIRGLSKK